MSGCAGNEPFALQVLGDSMEPEFPDGVIIIVEPGGVIKHECYVVAEYDEEFILRQLSIEEDHIQLKPLNQQYPTISIPELSAIKGRVIQRCGQRRKDHKSYL